ncbi:MAG: hypothetical protein IJW44_03045 [Clostridia bacterium]|nr:hypothetical protein [Clostridia bacterium]
MQKIDKVVLRETKLMALWVLILSAILQAVFLVIGAWDYKVLLGNLLSGSAVVLNFLAMGITVQNCLQKEEKDAKQAMRASGLLRLFVLFIVGLIGVLVPVFSAWTVIIPLFFPRFIIALRPLWDKEMRSSKKAAVEKSEKKEDSEHEA